jgi:hypothetical protein
MTQFKIDQEDFNRKAQHILDTVVKPQVEKYEQSLKESAFHKADTIDGQWLSPVKEEREWQEQKLLEIFGHENAGPRWQYMNGLIDIALEYIELTKEQDDTI